MDWERLREHLLLWFTRAAQFVLFENVVLYLTGCAVAERLLTPANYAAFLYRMLTYR